VDVGGGIRGGCRLGLESGGGRVEERGGCADDWHGWKRLSLGSRLHCVLNALLARCLVVIVHLRLEAITLGQALPTLVL
jgi:hypothetical protein